MSSSTSVSDAVSVRSYERQKRAHGHCGSLITLACPRPLACVTCRRACESMPSRRCGVFPVRHSLRSDGAAVLQYRQRRPAERWVRLGTWVVRSDGKGKSERSGADEPKEGSEGKRGSQEETRTGAHQRSNDGEKAKTSQTSLGPSAAKIINRRKTTQQSNNDK